MRILLTGGTGLIGQALCQHWQPQGHELWVWSRRPPAVAALCSGARGVAKLEDLPADVAFDAVINLAGAPIADSRWTQSRRQLLRRSRIELTRTLVDWMTRQATPAPVLISGSATGWYGNQGEQLLDEASASGPADFGSELCHAWEQEAERARQWGVRVVLLRTAPVLSPTGGMLGKLRLPFSLGLGGRLGSGQQWMPWIALQDEVALIDFFAAPHRVQRRLQRLRAGAGEERRVHPSTGPRPAPPGHPARAGVGAAAGAGGDVGVAAGRPAPATAPRARGGLCVSLSRAGRGAGAVGVNAAHQI